MEQSAQNPYIPQESEEVRQKVYEHQSPLGRVVKWALIITAVIAVLVGAGLFFVVPKTTAVDQSARTKLAEAFQPPALTEKRVSVVSTLGFKLNYDNHLFSSYAEVGDSTAGTAASTAVTGNQTYNNNELRVSRAYNYVRVRPVESIDTSRALVPLPPELELFATVTNKDLTDASNATENKGLSKLSVFVKIDTAKRLAKKVADDNTVVAIESTKPVSTTIAGIEYQKVRFTTTNDNHRISDVKYDECYYTIQNDQPYAACVANVRPTTVSAASLVEMVLGSISYEEPSNGDSSASTKTPAPNKSSFLPTFRLAQAVTGGDSSSASSSSGGSAPADSSSSDDATDDNGDTSDQSALLTVTPQYKTDENSLKAITKNQPSIVRIGTIYCADLTLKFQSGETAANITDACVGNVASGAIISKDGYIATTGHAIRQQKKAAIGGYINFAPTQDAMLDRLQYVLDYLLKSKVILQSDADYLKTGAQTNDQEALAKIQNIGSLIQDDYVTAVNEEYSYAIQPSDKQIVVNTTDANKPTFAYSDSVISAKYFASNYDATKSVQEVFGSTSPSSDIGLLKAEGNFQELQIAPSEDMKANDTLTTLGYPAYTDSSLSVDANRNQPLATVSKVDQAYNKDGGRLIQTDTPVMPGYDGAPVFDSTGKLVGFAVYGLTYCPDQTACFGNGTVRPLAELQKLLDSKNVKLQTGSVASTNWTDGIDQFFHANYAVSTSSFASAGGSYRYNIWAAKAGAISTKQQGSPLDTSLMNQLQIIMIVVLSVLVVITILLGIVYALHRARLRQLQVGHYGAADTAPVLTAPLAPVTTPYPQVQPVQQVMPSAPIQQQPYVQPPQQVILTPPTQIPVQQAPSPAQPYPSQPVAAPQPQEPTEQPQNQPEDPFYK